MGKRKRFTVLLTNGKRLRIYNNTRQYSEAANPIMCSLPLLQVLTLIKTIHLQLQPVFNSFYLTFFFKGYGKFKIISRSWSFIGTHTTETYSLFIYFCFLFCFVISFSTKSNRQQVPTNEMRRKEIQGIVILDSGKKFQRVSQWKNKIKKRGVKRLLRK